MKINIEASKFYIASDHKKEIKSAYNRVFNRGLTIQHPEQLNNGDEAEEEAKKAEEARAQEKEDNTNVSANPSYHAPSGGSTVNINTPAPADFTPSDNDLPDDTTEDKQTDTSDTTSDTDTSENASSSASIAVKPEVGVPELQDVSIIDDDKKKVEGQTVLYRKATTASCTIDETKSAINSIVGLLNAKDDTCGVRMAQVVDMKELWIYYQDDKNLNDVMEPVIKLLCQSDYSWLSFSRLARKDNAIVFDINSVGVENDDRQPETEEK